MKHTPGPWAFKHDNCSEFKVRSIKGDLIVFGCGCCGSPNIENEADAPLIASAPDLLQALKQMLDAFHHDPLGGGQDAAIEAALDAFAKAEGEK